MRSPAGALSATLVDEWGRGGLSFAAVAPGSRSTPLALALAESTSIRHQVVLDERSAAFTALGHALYTGRPALVLTTSGTATAELHAAVLEAHHAQVPLVVCTADRPPELQAVGAPQTVDQHRLYGQAVRFHVDLGPPDDATRPAWRSVAARVLAEAVGPPAGPVQLNLPFREPLAGPAGPLPPGRPHGGPWHRRVAGDHPPPAGLVSELAAVWSGRRGVIVAGAGIADPDPVLALAGTLGWPVLADPRSGCRVEHPAVVAHADAILRSPRACADLAPDIALRLGAPPASKVLGQWLAVDDLDVTCVDASGSWWDPDRRARLVVASPPARFAEALTGALGAPPAGASGPAAGWLARWRQADDAAGAAMIETLSSETTLTEPAAARAVATAAHNSGTAALVVSSSMPVRDLEWYAPRAGCRPALRVLANRGANGIDGVVSTAVGAALAADGPVWLLIGDLALLHDSNALLGLVRRPLRLRIVVVDNDGGGIFSFLPQAGVVPADRFEELFGTPHGIELAALFALHGIAAEDVADPGDLGHALDRLATRPEPVAALVLRTDRAANTAAHERLHRAVVERVDAVLAPPSPED